MSLEIVFPAGRAARATYWRCPRFHRPFPSPPPWCQCLLIPDPRRHLSLYLFGSSLTQLNSSCRNESLPERRSGRTKLHMPRGGDSGERGEAGLTGLILIARGRSVDRSPVLTLSSNPKEEEERSKRPRRRSDRGQRRGGGDESKKTPRQPRPTTDAYRVSRKIRTKREVWGRTRRNVGRRG